MSLRLLMMGTGTFALPTFLALCESNHEVIGLVTQPDRIGRGHHHHPHPMKTAALARGVAVFQPESVNTPESLDRLRRFSADVYVVAAYGQILSADLLEIPRLGAVNLHASLLPKYRGAAPIQYAVWQGDAETGVTIFRIEPQLDAGPILGRVATAIGPRETSGDVEARLADLAAPLTLGVLAGLESGTLEPVPQASGQSTRARKLSKEQGLVDWGRTAREIDCQVRAMQPWPMPYTFLHSPECPPQRLLILQVAPTTTSADALAPPGAVQRDGTDRLLVRCGDGVVEVLRVQPAGKRAMSAQELLRGFAFPPHSRLGTTELDAKT